MCGMSKCGIIRDLELDDRCSNINVLRPQYAENVGNIS